MSTADIDWDALKSQLNEMMDEDDDDMDSDLFDIGGPDEDDDDFDDDFDYANYQVEPSVSKQSLIAIGEKKDEQNLVLGDFITEEDVYENSQILYPEEKTYRSLILEVFKPRQLIELEKLSRTFSISNNQKIKIIREKLDEWNIKYSPLGGGTNRYAIMIDGYVIKIACDKDGKIDNKREFMYSIPLQPKVTKCYETSPDGLVAVFEYVEIFTIDDFWKNQDKMREILSDIAVNFLIGDVGVSSKNYTNWGFRDDGSLVILDYAYIYSVSFKRFTCSCSPDAVLFYDQDFNNLICPICGKKYSFSDIRKKISRKDQDLEIGDITEKGYVLDSVEQVKKFNPKFVMDATENIMKKLIKIKKKQDRKLTSKKKSPEDVDALSIDEIISKIENGEF